jgi:transposase-like protein
VVRPGRPLTALELRHLALLLEVREQAHQLSRLYDERLEDFVLECRESGASARGMAEALGVGPSTIQNWTTNARRRRREGG